MSNIFDKDLGAPPNSRFFVISIHPCPPARTQELRFSVNQEGFCGLFRRNTVVVGPHQQAETLKAELDVTVRYRHGRDLSGKHTVEVGP